MKHQKAKALLETELPGIIEKVAVAKKQFDNYSLMSVFNSQIEVYEICKSLSFYAYQIETVVIKQGIIQMGLPEIAEDFFHSAAYPNNMQSILKENADTLKSYCKLFGKKIDNAFLDSLLHHDAHL
jgi:protein associated with RNAse G/E